MTPLQVTATLQSPIALPGYPLALDAILAYAVCQRDSIPPTTLTSEMQPIEVPIQRSPCGRFHLASVGFYELEQADHRYIHKRAPIREMQSMGSAKIKRVQVTAGPNKSYRIPLPTMHLVDDLIMWWCIGERDEIEALLDLVHYLGKKRSRGLGKVARWTIEAMEPWDGFPVMRDGKPLRNLPIDYAGLREGVEQRYANVTYPYWDLTSEELCACPLVAGS